MSVNAINAAEPQQPKKSAMGAAIGTGVALGAAGAGAGWYFAPRPSLEELLKNTDADTFTRQEVIDKDKEAAEKLDKAKKEYQAAGKTEGEQLAAARKAKAELVNGQTVENQAELENAIKEAKAKFHNKQVEVGEGKKLTIVEAEKNVQDKAKALKTAAEADKEAAQTALNSALEDAKKVRQGVAEEQKAYREAQKNLATAKKNAFNEAAKTADSEADKAIKNITEKKTKFTEVKSNKLTELLTDENKAAYKKIKGAFEKVGQKKLALIYGGCALAAGVILGAIFGGSKKEEA